MHVTACLWICTQQVVCLGKNGTSPTPQQLLLLFYFFPQGLKIRKYFFLCSLFSSPLNLLWVSGCLFIFIFELDIFFCSSKSQSLELKEKAIFVFESVSLQLPSAAGQSQVYGHMWQKRKSPNKVSYDYLEEILCLCLWRHFIFRDSCLFKTNKQATTTKQPPNWRLFFFLQNRR